MSQAKACGDSMCIFELPPNDLTVLNERCKIVSPYREVMVVRYAARLFNTADWLGVAAVVVSYFHWSNYQMAQRQRGELEVHLAMALALVAGLVYRVYWQRVPSRYAEIGARTAFLASAVLVFAGWVTEAVTLAAGANLQFLLDGARFSQRARYAVYWMSPLLYLILVFIAPTYEDLLFRMIVGFYFLSMFAGEMPEEDAQGGKNPYAEVLGNTVAVIFLLFLPTAAIALLVSPRATTAEGQLVERVLAGFGLSLLLLVAVCLLAERRIKHGDEHRPPDAGTRAPVSPRPVRTSQDARPLPDKGE